MTRKYVGIVLSVLLLTTACTSTDDSSGPTRTTYLQPSGSVNPAYTSAQASRTRATTPAAASSTTQDRPADSVVQPTTTATPLSDPPLSSMSTTQVEAVLDPTVSTGTFHIDIAEGITDADQPLAVAGADLATNSIILGDLLNRDSADTRWDPLLPAYFYGQLLQDRISTTQAARANGRHQTGWMSADLYVLEVAEGAITIEACLDTTDVVALDASGAEIPKAYPIIHASFGLYTYEPGLRISFMEATSPDGTRCAG